jgi:hypothetical protein
MRDTYHTIFEIILFKSITHAKYSIYSIYENMGNYFLWGQLNASKRLYVMVIQ